MKTQLKADLSLVTVTMFWGASCLLTKVGLDGIQAFNLISLRFLIAFALSGLVFRKRLQKVNLVILKHSALLGSILFIVLVFMTFGVKNTSVSNAGFLTCLAGVFIPILSFIILRQKQNPKVMASVALAFVGVYLLTINGALMLNIGDLLCILCSLIFAIHIMITDRLTKADDSISLGVLQLGFVGIHSLIFSFLLETPTLPSSQESWLIVLGLSIFCSAFGFITQTIAQRHTTAAHTGLIFCLEPAFAAIFALIFLKEILTLRGYIGEILLFLSIILVEIDIDKYMAKIIVKKDV